MSTLTLVLALLAGGTDLPAQTEIVHDFEHLTRVRALTLNGRRGLYLIVNDGPVNTVNLGLTGEAYIDCRSADDTYRKLFPLGWHCGDKKVIVEATLRVVFHDTMNVRGVTGWWEYRLERAVRRRQ
jgi:hypothetical protein